MFNKNQQKRLYNASSLGGGEIKSNCIHCNIEYSEALDEWRRKGFNWTKVQGSHAEQWTKLSEKDKQKISRRILQVSFELVNESPHLFSTQGILDVKNEMKKEISLILGSPCYPYII